ncbi:MAG: RidA family protein [Promethearchaeota archaeon]
MVRMVEMERIDVRSEKGGPYSHGIKAGGLIFVSGQVGDRDAKTLNMLSSEIENQTMQALNKLKVILEAGGAQVKNIAKVTVFLANIALFSRMNAAYKQFFIDNGVTERFPARTTVEAKLARDDILIEIDCFAVV